MKDSSEDDTDKISLLDLFDGETCSAIIEEESDKNYHMERVLAKLIQINTSCSEEKVKSNYEMKPNSNRRDRTDQLK